MSVNLEVKGSLAKCLATENIIIEHKKIPTAYFDVDRRILALPTWDKASAIVYDLLVGHEVGHALFTDNIDWKIDYPNLPKDFVNVIEDVRVERLMKKKYPGLSKTFYRGYNELHDDDFFCTKDEDLNKLSFIDRINLYFKVGAFLNIEFSDEENEFVTRISKTETFDDVLVIASEIFEYVKSKKKEENKEQQKSPKSDIEVQQGSSESEDQSNISESNFGENDEQDSEEESDANSEEPEPTESLDQTEETLESPSDTPVDELESKTSKNFEDKSKDLVDMNSSETAYVELPEFNLNNLIIPNNWIHSKCKEFYTNYNGYIDELSKSYVSYKKSAEKEVSYLVKEFECKKSASTYARATTARTGLLDTSKLHTYKFNEDLFKKISVIPDGKNHGLIFILDWSGSMADYLLDTVKQMFNLIWFCKKVNIPFEVYAFTLEPKAYVELQPDHPRICNDNVAGMVSPERSFRLMNFLTSNVNSRELDAQMKHIWFAATAFQKKVGWVPYHIELSGSPIGETILALHQLIPQFKKNNSLEKVNIIFLTDGEGYVNATTVERKYNSDGIGRVRANKNAIRDRKTGRVYSSYNCDAFPKYCKIILQTIKEKFPTVNLINFRITASRDFKNCCYWYGDSNMNLDDMRGKFRKHHFLTFYDTGFDQFNIIGANSLSQDASFEIPEDATKSQIKTAFTKMLSKKRTNKKLLSSFVELIA